MDIVNELGELAARAVTQARERIECRLHEKGVALPLRNFGKNSVDVAKIMAPEFGWKVKVDVNLDLWLEGVVAGPPELGSPDFTGIHSPAELKVKTRDISAHYAQSLRVTRCISELELAQGDRAAKEGVMVSLYEEISNRLVETESTIIESLMHQMNQQSDRSHSPVAPPQPRAQSKPTAKKSAPEIAHDEGFGAW